MRGARNLERNPLAKETLLAGIKPGEASIAALVEALFAHYERGQRAYEVGIAEAVTLPVMARLLADVAAHVRGLVRAATTAFEPDSKHLNLAVGLCDFRVWRSLTQAGLSTADAAELTSRLIASALPTNP